MKYVMIITQTPLRIWFVIELVLVVLVVLIKTLERVRRRRRRRRRKCGRRRSDYEQNNDNCETHNIIILFLTIAWIRFNFPKIKKSEKSDFVSDCRLISSNVISCYYNMYVTWCYFFFNPSQNSHPLYVHFANSFSSDNQVDHVNYVELLTS